MSLTKPNYPSAAMQALIKAKFEQNVRAMRAELWEEQGGLCYYCKLPFPFDEGNVEHKQPRSKGGSNERVNLAFTCIPCNSLKGNMTEKQFRRKLRKQ